MNGLLHVAAQNAGLYIKVKTLKQGHTAQNHSATVSKNMQLFS